MTTILILHLCNCVYLSLFLYLSHVNGAEWNKSSCLVLSCPLHNGQLGDRRVACAASVSARVCRESWNESKKKRNDLFFCSRSNFRAITRLETLATQANGSGEVTVRGGSTVFIYLFIYLFTHSSTYERLSTLPGSICPTRRCEDEPFAILIITFSFFFSPISKYLFNRS